MSGHTPGPWSLIKEHDGHRITATVNSPNDTLARTYEYVAGGINGITKQPDEANARLMAAAPDLLAALKAIADLPYLTEESAWTWKDTACKMTDLASAAIAKAEGR